MTYVKNYSPPPVRRQEILRYAGVKGDASNIQALLDECLQEAELKLSYRVCWESVPVFQKDGVLDLGFAEVPSRDLAKNLKSCEKAILFAATVGPQLDMLIARYSRISPAKALLLNAIGAERIESLCDLFCYERKAQGDCLRPRFSPGYGDLPLSFQKDIFRALDCPGKIGLTLNESLVMSPSKSVTALTGIGKQVCDQPAGCAACAKPDCAYRRSE